MASTGFQQGQELVTPTARDVAELVTNRLGENMAQIFGWRKVTGLTTALLVAAKSFSWKVLKNLLTSTVYAPAKLE